jgi:MFS superfamily sulfate permease-like transporter
MATAVVALFSLQEDGILVGAVPAGLPTPAIPALSLADLQQLTVPAIGVSFVAYTDNVLTARAFALKAGQPIDANQEWTALAAANTSASLFHGFPVSSSGSRTALGAALGCRTQLYSLVTLLLLVSTLVVAGPLLAGFPKAALGALVIFAAVRRGYVPGIAGMHDVDDYPLARQIPSLLVYRYDAPLCFANAENFRRRALAALDAEPEPPRWFLLNAEANVEIDSTAAQTLESLHAELGRRGIVLALARVKQDLRVNLQAAGLIDLIGEERIFMTLPTAVETFRAQGRSSPE